MPKIVTTASRFQKPTVSLLIAAVLARPLPVPVIKRVTEPARRQNASKCHQQGSDKRCPQDHRGSHDPKSKLRRVGSFSLIYSLCRAMWMHEFHVRYEGNSIAKPHCRLGARQHATRRGMQQDVPRESDRREHSSLGRPL